MFIREYYLFHRNRNYVSGVWHLNSVCVYGSFVRRKQSYCIRIINVVIAVYGAKYGRKPDKYIYIFRSTTRAGICSPNRANCW